MKNFFTLVFTVSSLFFLSACATDEEIADELIDYYNNEWIPIHETKGREMDTVTSKLINLEIDLDEDNETEFVKESTELYNKDLIPAVDKAIERYESLQINNRQVKKLNKKQIKVDKNERDYLKSVIDYANDDISLSENQQIENEVKRRIHEVNDYLEELMEKYNLEYDKEKDSRGGFYDLKRKED